MPAAIPPPPILGMYQTGGAFPTPGPAAWPSGPTTNLSATYLSWEADWPTYAAPFVAECNSNSLVPFVELEPWNWDKSPIPFADIVDGAYDSQLEGYGTAIAATGKPVVLTFAHEFNVSGQYPWAQDFTQTVGGTASGTGGADLTPAQWIAGWNYVRNKVNSTAGGYAIWIWACSAYTSGTTISPASYWPGSTNVDMVGIDGYCSTRWGAALGTFTGQIEPTVSIIRGLGWTNPIFISETNLAQMADGGTDNTVSPPVTFGPGESIPDFVADMHAAGCSGILEFEDAGWNLPQMSTAQWTQYNTAVAEYYGGGGGAALTASAHLAVTPARRVTTSGGAPVTRASASLAVTPSLSAAAVRTGLVQETSGSTTGTTLTLTFPRAVGIGHAVIVAIAGYYDGTVTGIALGTSGGTFTHNGSSGGTGGNNAGIFSNLSATQSTATLTITTSAAGILAWAYEVAGTLALDVLAGNTGTGKSWSSGAVEPIPYPHFIVGLGSVIANTGSIGGPSSGWVNEPAITDVVGAGSHAIGAVSGYQQAATSGTYTYSGTSGSSSAWGAVTAAFLIIPPGGNIQPAWGGVVFTEHEAAGYTGISATFTIPGLGGGQYNSVWVGLGNVYQVGIYQTYSTSYAGNSTSRPWSWWLPGSGEQWKAAAYPTAAGDTLTLSIELTAADWLMTIGNATEGWSYTEVRSALAVNIGSISDYGAGPAVWPNPGSAEIIIEKETTELAAYGELAFTEITTVPPATRAPYPVFTVNADIDQYPGAYSVAGASFVMYWNNYS